MDLLQSAMEKAEGEGVYIVSYSNAREFSGQPFSAMNKCSFHLEPALPLSNTFTSAFMQTHQSFFHQNA